MKEKVFGLGLSRTGTTSLHLALLTLGYAACHYPRDIAGRDWLFGRFQQNSIDAYDAFTDLPTPIYFRELHAIYPDAKFIYTTRDKQAWLRSVAEHWQKSMPSSGKTVLRDLIRASVYGVVGYNESIFSQFYDEHERRVLEYFAAFPDQFLIMDISLGDGWDKLCGFLGVVDMPNMQFPRARSPILPGGLGNVPRSQYDEKTKAYVRGQSLNVPTK